MPGSRCASIVLPVPGGPSMSMWCPPAAAISRARLATACPATSARSGPTVGRTIPLEPLPPRVKASGSSPRRWATTAASDGAARRRAPRTTAASARFAVGTTTAAPAAVAASTIGSTPRTGRRAPSSESSPTSHTDAASAAVTRPAAISTPAAIARSSSAPSLRSSAGDRLTRMVLVSIRHPRWRMAASTRSRASRTAGSGSPTTASCGVPARASTST